MLPITVRLVGHGKDLDIVIARLILFDVDECKFKADLNQNCEKLSDLIGFIFKEHVIIACHN